MKTYELEIMEKELYEWSKKEGEGDYFDYLYIGKKGNFTTEKLSVADIVATIKDIMFVEINTGNLNFCNIDVANFDILENEQGYQDEQNGDYIARYGFTVREILPTINLEKLFG